jgi:hypothetical protein
MLLSRPNRGTRYSELRAFEWSEHCRFEKDRRQDKHMSVGRIFGCALLVLVCSDQVKPQSRSISRATKDLSIVDGSSCNDPNPPGRLKYLRNGNESKSVIARIRVSVVSEGQGKIETSIETYTVPPKSNVELGCDRVGGGAPIVEDISWKILSAKYK